MGTQIIEFATTDFQRVRRIGFITGDGGTAGDSIAVGDVITEDGAGTAEGYVAQIEIDSGAFADGDAAGTIWYVKKNNNSDEFAGGTGGDTCSVTGKTAGFTIDSVDANGDGVLDLRSSNSTYVAKATYTPATGFSAPVDLLRAELVIEIAAGAAQTYGFDLDTGDSLYFPVSMAHGRHCLDHREGAFAFFARWNSASSILELYLVMQGIQGEGDADSAAIPDCVLSVALGSSGTAGDLLDLDFADIAGLHLAFETSEDLTGGSGGGVSKNLPPSWGVGNIIQK